MRVLGVELEMPAALSVAVHGSDGSDFELERSSAEQHLVTLAGLHADTHYEVEFELSFDDGVSKTGALSFDSVALPQDFPHLEVHALGRVEPGFTLLPVNLGQKAWLVALDEQLEPAWVLPVDQGMYDVDLDGDQIVAVVGSELRRWDLYGRELSVDDDELYHHAVHVLPDEGLLTLSTSLVEVEDHPLDYDGTLRGPATLRDDRIVELDASGRELWSMSTLQLFDLDRLRCGSLDVRLGGYDHTHINAAVPLDDGGVLISARNQDTLQRLDADGQAVWILSDPEGWGPEFQPLLLRPVGPDFEYTHQQHAPEVAPDGSILVFDNGGCGAPESRVVAFRVDEDARTVEQLWEWRSPEGLYSGAMGDADHLDETGNVLAVWGYMRREGGVSNLSRDRGELSARVIELHPGEAAPRMDVSLWTDEATSPGGVWTYRAERIPPLRELFP